MTLSATQAMAQNLSFWQFKYGDYQPEPALTGGLCKADVVVIGGGFTGLTAARELRRDNPELKVLVLEAREIGFGASGRNGGFSMTLFGMEPEVTEALWGRDRTRQAQDYMKQAVSYVKDLVETERLDSDYEHTGMWRLAYSAPQEKRLKNTYQLLTDLMGPDDYRYLNQDEVQAKLNAPHVRGAIVEPGTGILDPTKHVRELKRLALAAGARIFENTKVVALTPGPDMIRLRTETGVDIEAGKVVLAVNAWAHTFDKSVGLRRKQRPLWTYQVVTEPLTEEEWADIRWDGRMSIEDNRHLIHYMRITKCGRITMGGGSVNSELGTAMDKWQCEKTWRNLEAHLRWLFPTLKNKPIAYKWGGAVSVNADMTPEICFLGDNRIIHASGCIGHGVSLTQLNGRLIADLVQEKETELSRFWIVDRKARSIPPGDLISYLGGRATGAVFDAIDWWQERSLPGR